MPSDGRNFLDLGHDDNRYSFQRHTGVSNQSIESRYVHGVDLLVYSEPHGIRITGLRFLTHVSYPFSIVLHNAIHEPMHPPYHADEPKVRDAIDLLGRDPLVADKVQHHDPSFGYNTTAGYIEEDSVQALEQLVSEKFGVGRNCN